MLCHLKYIDENCTDVDDGNKDVEQNGDLEMDSGDDTKGDCDGCI